MNESKPANRPFLRPVARRACLLCREKKIKCDGEPILTVVSLDGLNKVVPQTTRVCSNCKFLGTECVFVQLNRGGRRKKRDPDDETASKRSRGDTALVLLALSYPGYPPNPILQPPVMPKGQHSFVLFPGPPQTPTQGQTPLTPDPYVQAFKPQVYHAQGSPGPSVFGATSQGYQPIAPPSIYSDNLGSDVTDSRLAPLSSSRANSVVTTPKIVLPPLENPPSPGILPRFRENGRGSVSSNNVSINSGVQTNVLGPSSPHRPGNWGPMHNAVCATDLGTLMPLVAPKLSGNPQRWTDAELAEYDLPPWEMFDRALDVYYKYFQPNHQVLPARQKLLRRSSLNYDALVFHGIMANVCLVDNEGLDINHDERYWMDLVDKHYEDMNDVSLLLCYTLVCKCLYVRFNLPKLNEMNTIMWEIVLRNDYMEIFSSERMGHYNRGKGRMLHRQIYEHELVIRLIWSFYINNMVMLRLSRGFPYHKLGYLLGDDSSTAFEGDTSFNKLVLPLLLTNFLEENMCLPRQNLRDVEKAARTSDICCLLLGTRMLEKVLDGITNNNLVNDEATSINPEIQHQIDTTYMVINHEERLLCVHLVVFLVKFITLAALLLKHLYFMHDILSFKLFKKDYIKLMTPKLTPPPNNALPASAILPLIADVSVTNFGNFEEYPRLISDFSVSQWNNFTRLVIAAFDFHNLIELDAVLSAAAEGDYEIAFGPTLTDHPLYKPWYRNPLLRSSTKEAWVHYTEFALVAACINLLVLASLAVLTKYIVIKPDPQGCLTVTLLATNETKLFSGIKVPACLGDDFNLENFQRKLIVLRLFIRLRLRAYLDLLYTNTTSKLDRMSHYLEEILTNVKTST